MRRALVLPLLALALIARADDAPLSDDEFTRTWARVVPAERERWETIPWETDLLAARARAVQEGKPLFLWAMNGHPLGCT